MNNYFIFFLTIFVGLLWQAICAKQCKTILIAIICRIFYSHIYRSVQSETRENLVQISVPRLGNICLLHRQFSCFLGVNQDRCYAIFQLWYAKIEKLPGSGHSAVGFRDDVVFVFTSFYCPTVGISGYAVAASHVVVPATSTRSVCMKEKTRDLGLICACYCTQTTARNSNNSNWSWHDIALSSSLLGVGSQITWHHRSQGRN